MLEWPPLTPTAASSARTAPPAPMMGHVLGGSGAPSPSQQLALVLPTIPSSRMDLVIQEVPRPWTSAARAEVEKWMLLLCSRMEWYLLSPVSTLSLPKH